MGFLRSLGFPAMPDAIILDESSLELVTELEVGGTGADIAASFDAMWVAAGSGQLSRVDPRTMAVTLETRLPHRPLRVVCDEHGPIVLGRRHELMRIDPATGAVRAQADVRGAVDVAVGSGCLWALKSAGEGPYAVSLLRLDPTTLSLREELTAGESPWPAGPLLVQDGVVSTLLYDEAQGMVPAVFDALTGVRLDAARAPRPSGIARQDGQLWRCKGDAEIQRIAVDGGAVLARRKLKGIRIGDVERAHGCLWILTRGTGNHDPQSHGL